MLRGGLWGLAAVFIGINADLEMGAALAAKSAGTVDQLAGFAATILTGGRGRSGGRPLPPAGPLAAGVLAGPSPGDLASALGLAFGLESERLFVSVASMGFVEERDETRERLVLKHG